MTKLQNLDLEELPPLDQRHAGHLRRTAPRAGRVPLRDGVVGERFLRSITRRVVRACRPSLIISFGSRVYGKPRPDSDLDLLVVMDADGSWGERHRKIADLFPNSPITLDAHVYTPDEALHRLEIGDYFMQDVFERGRVVYQRADARRLARQLQEKLREGKTPMTDEYTEEWIAKAEADYKTARVLARQRRDFSPDNLCWTCQQCTEKYFKAFLVRHRVKFQRTHDLNTLCEQCMRTDPDFRLVRDSFQVLNKCQPPVRYPGESVSEVEAREAFETMKRLRQFGRAKLGLR